MSLEHLIVLLIVAGISGSLGQSIVGYSRNGCFASIALGFVGALIGMVLARKLGLPEPMLVQVGGTSFPVVWSIAGSALFVALTSFLRGRPRIDGD